MPLKKIDGGRGLVISISIQSLVTDNRFLPRLFLSNAMILPRALPISFKISGLIYSMGRWGREIQIEVKRVDLEGEKFDIHERVSKGKSSRNQGQVDRIRNLSDESMFDRR